MNRVAPQTFDRERGAAVALFTITLTSLMVVAAFAIDVGLLFSERRQDQAAADTGVLAGALELGSGVDAASEAAAAIVRNNLPTTYTDAEWTAMWSACTDGDRYSQLGEVLGVTTQCISSDGTSVFRVKLPQQAVDTALLGVLGVETLSASAFAEASYEKAGVEGPIPFSVLGNAASGTELCLRDAATGQSLPPCFGNTSGNFGGLEIGQYGNPQYGTEGLGCNLNKSDQIAINIAVGVDHDLSIYQTNEVRDICDTAFLPNTLNTFQGLANGTFEGLIGGITVASRTFDGMLTSGTTGATRELTKGGDSWQADNVPLWEYIGYGKAGTVPVGCEREAFDAEPDYATNTANLTACMTAHSAGSGYAPLFDYDGDSDSVLDIENSVRFAIVPQFLENTFPSGNGWLHVREYRRIYLNDIYFDCNGSGSCGVIFRPGEDTSSLGLPGGAGAKLDQVTGHLLPNGTLPLELQIPQNPAPIIRLTR